LTKRAMAKLSGEIQVYVVERLAGFDHPAFIAADVAEEFGVEVSRQAIQRYDPTSHAGRDLSEKWRDLFWATRKAFLENTAKIGVSHRAVRLRAVQRLASRAEAEGDLDLALKALDQAHREMSDVYCARRQATSKAPDMAAIEARKAELLTGLAARIGRINDVARAHGVEQISLKWSGAKAEG
jgi:hypothetical protein